MRSLDVWGVIQPAFIFISAATGIFLMAINLRKARTIEDTPIAKIRSAAQGYLSVNGITKSLDDDMVIAPLTGRPCLWYHYTIERRDSDDDGSRWTTIERGTSEKLFVLDDTTGICHIDPHRAEVTAAISQCWQGDERRPLAPPRGPQSNSIFSQRYRLFSSGRYRYRENRIHAQEWLYALGWFETLHAPSLAERTETQTKLLLNEWKQNRAALLARFDLNRDGEISVQEWERARRAARQQAETEVRDEPSAVPVNTMSHSPLRDQPYLIGTKDPRDMARKYRRDAFISLIAGVGFSVFLFWKFYWH